MVNKNTNGKRDKELNVEIVSSDNVKRTKISKINKDISNTELEKK